MDCAEFQEIVHELARNNAVDAVGESIAVRARLHAEICGDCAARLEEARHLAKAVATTAEDAKIWEAPAILEEQLAGAFRDHHRNLERARYRERRVRLRWAEWIGLAAAAAVLVTIGAWTFSHGHAVKSGNSEATVSSTTNPSSSGLARNTADVTQTADAGEDFVPVPYGENLSAEDSGFVVRVSMTRGTLESLGYPVDEANAGDVIQADVLVGEDGSPVAVRLVQ